MKATNNIPETLLSKVFDATGSASGGNRGYIIAMVNSNGDPTIISRFENSCVSLALRKALELFVDTDNQQLNQ